MANLWTDKYKPDNPGKITGQNKAVADALEFVKHYKPGTALMITGPPGSGKSSIPETIALELGLSLMRLNASDKRTKGEIESFIQTTKTHSLFTKGKIILIDELEGLSGGDRGAVSGIVSLVKQSRFPVFLVSSDDYVAKLAPLKLISKVIKLTKVPIPSMEKRLKEICDSEGIAPEEGVLKTLTRFSQGDLRSAITDLQMASHGKNTLTMHDLESIGYRDRAESIHDTLPKIFRSGNIAAASKAMLESDKDPDELFLWIESNAQLEYSGTALAEAMEIISKADVFMSMVRNQRNYQFLKFAMDSLAGLATISQNNRYVLYRPPDKIIMMGRSKIRRSIQNSLCKKIGRSTHASTRIVREYLPYLKLAMVGSKSKQPIQGIEFTPEELSMLRS